MLKKAGIVAAAGAASLVALSPLAFAGEKTEVNDSYKSNTDNKSYTKVEKTNQIGSNGEQVAGDTTAGLVNVSGNNLNLSPQTCVGGLAATGNGLVQGALGLFSEDTEATGKAKADNGVDCTNASDNGDEFNQSESESGKHDGGHK